MSSSYAEETGSVEPSDDVEEGSADPQHEFEGEVMPQPPETPTEDDDR